jgi:hypothetical protein
MLSDGDASLISNEGLFAESPRSLIGEGRIFSPINVVVQFDSLSLWEYQQHVAATSTIREETVDPKNKGFLGKFLGRGLG